MEIIRILGSCVPAVLSLLQWINMYSTWFNFNLTYYVGKLFGLYPFAGNYKNLSFCYSLVVWIALCYASITVHNSFHEYSDTIPSSQKLLKYVNYFIHFVKYLY